jgi:hypothetical protein
MVSVPMINHATDVTLMQKAAQTSKAINVTIRECFPGEQSASPRRSSNKSTGRIGGF